MEKLNELLEILHLGLMVNSPDWVKDARFIFDYNEEKPSEGITIPYGNIQLYIETFNDSFIVDYQTMYISEGIDIQDALCAFARSLIEEEDYIGIWNKVEEKIRE